MTARGATVATLQLASAVFPAGAMIFLPYQPGDLSPTWLPCNADAAHSRATYPALFAALTFTQSGTTSSGVATVTGLSSTAQMRAGMRLEGTGIPANTTILTVDSGTQVTMSANATGSATVTVTFFPHGAPDASNFYVPNMRQRMAVGVGTKKLGESGGSVDHTHTANTLTAAAHTHGKVFSGPYHSHGSDNLAIGNHYHEVTGVHVEPITGPYEADYYVTDLVGGVKYQTTYNPSVGVDGSSGGNVSDSFGGNPGTAPNVSGQADGYMSGTLSASNPASFVGAWLVKT